MAGFEERRALVHDVFVALTALADEVGAPEVASRLAGSQRRLSDGRLVALVLGEFKRGKSTLLNALLGEPGLLPVDTYYATRLVTTVSWAQEEHVEFVPADGAPKRVLTRAEIADYATESVAERVGAGEVVVGLPNDWLRQGLTIVDTPGIGGVYQAHTAATLACLPTADVVIYVLDASQPLLDGELAFVDRAAKVVAPESFVFVVTKADTVSDPGPIVEDARTRLAAALGVKDVVVIPVSGTAWLRFLADDDQEDRDESNFDRLHQQLATTLAHSRVRLLLGDALAECAAVADELAMPDKTALATLDAKDSAQRMAIAEAAQTASARLDALSAADADWPAELRTDLRTRADGILAETEAELAVGAWRGEDLALLSGQLVERINTVAATVLDDWTTRLDLTTHASPGLPAVTDVQSSPTQMTGITQHGAGRVSQAMQSAVSTGERTAQLGARLGGMIGVGLGNPRGGAVLGGTIGALVGTVLAYRESINELRAQDAAAQQAAEDRLRAQQRGHLRTLADDLVTALGDAVEQTLRMSLAARREAMRAAARESAAAAEENDEKFQQRRNAIVERLAPLSRLRSRIDDLAEQLYT
jgi:GTPase Era involved in 16S rRNA processing